MEEIDNGGDHRDHRLQRVARGATEPCLLARRAPQPALPEQHETGRPSTQRPPSGTKQRITITLVGSTICVQPTKRAMRRLGAMRIAEFHAGEPSIVEVTIRNEDQTVALIAAEGPS